MSTYQQSYRRAFQDFSGGLNDFSSPLTVLPNQFTELENALVNDRGLLEKIEGYTTDGSPFPNDVDSFIRMMVNYKRGTTVDKLVVAALDDGNTNASYKTDLKATSGDGTYSYIGYASGVCTFTNGSANVTAGTGAFNTHLKAGDKIKPDATSVWYEIDSVTGAGTLTLTSNFAEATQTLGAYTARIVLHKDFIPTAITFNNNLVVTNGSETPMSFNNTSLTLITDSDAPKGKFIEAHKGRVFIASTSGGPSTLFWSAANDETAWDATSLEPIFPQDGGNICAIKSFGDSLLVFKDNGAIYQVSGSFDQDAVGEPDFIRRLDTPDNIGVIAGRTVAVDENRLFFLARTGWYSIDSRMVVEKISWNVQNLSDSVVIAAGPASSKSYVFDSKTQWDTGTHSGTVATTAGYLTNFFDEYTISDAKQGSGLCAVHIDSSNVVRVAYVSSDGYTVRYKKYDADGTTTSEDISTRSNLVTEISIDKAANGRIGVSWSEQVSSTKLIYFSEYNSSWSAVENVSSSGDAYTYAMKYRSDSAARVARLGPYDATNTGIHWYTRSGTTWTFATSVSVGSASSPTSCAMTLNGSDDIFLSFNFGSNIRHFTSSNDGATFGSADTVAITTISTAARIHMDLNASGQAVTFFGDNGSLKKRNHSTTTTSVLDSGTDKAVGYAINTVSAVEKDNYVKVSSTGTESIIYEDSTAVANTVTALANTSYFTGFPGMSENGTVFAVSYFGANANEVLVKRYSPRAVYLTPEQSDSTLTAWGNYDVGSETVAGNSVTHAVAVATASPASSYNTITSGSLISTDTTKIFIIARVTVLLTAFAKTSIGSITLNFSGAGVDARQPVGVLYNNEYYTAVTESGNSNNNLIVLYDRGGVFTTFTPAVTCFCVYKTILYAGLATQGNVIKLRTGYSSAGSAYTLTATTKEDLLGSIELQKKIEKVYIVFEVQAAGTFDFSYRLDNFTSATAGSWTTTSIDQTIDGIYEVPIANTCKSVQFKIEQDEVDGRLGIIGFVVLYGYLNLR